MAWSNLKNNKEAMEFNSTFVHTAQLYPSGIIKLHLMGTHFHMLVFLFSSKNAEHSFIIFLMTDKSISTVSSSIWDLCFHAWYINYLKYVSTAAYFVIFTKHTNSLWVSLNLYYLISYQLIWVESFAISIQ